MCFIIMWVIIALFIVLLWYFRPIEYYDINNFPRLKQFENSLREIKHEYLQVSEHVNDTPRESEYCSGNVRMSETKAYLNSIRDIQGWVQVKHKPSWLNFPLYAYGVEFKNNMIQTPVLTNIIRANKDLINVCGFSRLLPNSGISNHVDSIGAKYGTMTYHLGLEVDDATLTVNGKTTREENDKSIIFDSSFVHSAKNNADNPRTILYVEFNTGV